MRLVVVTATTIGKKYATLYTEHVGLIALAPRFFRGRYGRAQSP
jgi:hypothetical protein